MGDCVWGRHNTTKRGNCAVTAYHDRSTGLFVVKVSVDDDMLQYLMKVKTSKEARDIFANIFAKKAKHIETMCATNVVNWDTLQGIAK